MRTRFVKIFFIKFIDLFEKKRESIVNLMVPYFLTIKSGPFLIHYLTTIIFLKIQIFI